MKRFSPNSTPAGDRDKKIKISQSELHALIKHEVCSAGKRNETKLQAFIEKMQHLDRGVDYESSIQKLQARINRLTKRAEAAFDYVFKKKAPGQIPRPSQPNNATVRAASENETASPSNRELTQLMETTKKALKKMHEDNEEFKAAVADLTEMSPRVERDAAAVEREPKGAPRTEEDDDDDYDEEEEEATTTKKARVERFSSGHSSIPEHTDSEQEKEKLSYPPLPACSFPSSIGGEAASYNVPKRPEVYLALIRNPSSLSVLWKVEVEDPLAPPMDTYRILMTTETARGTGVFAEWSALDEVKASPLPMCVMIPGYRPGRKVCVAVAGKDTFGRCGPYSEVVTAALPE